MRFEIFGENGFVIVVNIQFESFYFKDGFEKEYLESYKKEDKGFVGVFFVVIKEEGYVRQYRDVINVIKIGIKLFIFVEEGRYFVEIIFVIYFLSLIGKFVKFLFRSDEEVLKEIEKIKGKGF